MPFTLAWALCFPGCADRWGQPCVYICISLHTGIGTHPCVYTWLYLGRWSCSCLAPCRDANWVHAPSQKHQHCSKSSATDSQKALMLPPIWHWSYHTHTHTQRTYTWTVATSPYAQRTSFMSLIYSHNMSAFTPYRSILSNSWFPGLCWSRTASWTSPYQHPKPIDEVVSWCQAYTKF